MLLIPGGDFAWKKTRPDENGNSFGRVGFFVRTSCLVPRVVQTNAACHVGLWTMVYRAMDRGVSGYGPWCIGLWTVVYWAMWPDV